MACHSSVSLAFTMPALCALMETIQISSSTRHLCSVVRVNASVVMQQFRNVKRSGWVTPSMCGPSFTLHFLVSRCSRRSDSFPLVGVAIACPFRSLLLWCRTQISMWMYCDVSYLY
ncbi:hypothetical protein F5148DRAFT_758376 [Russula earlei]|uniref:Uncharacterized protein n=1 Tax=Russula earlei TaxID=71964 RepID=A0ACC0TT32_9AGAM|nr:hypothetical protein F5148DRAFT_758376 [Russula earlei]